MRGIQKAGALSPGALDERLDARGRLRRDDPAAGIAPLHRALQSALLVAVNLRGTAGMLRGGPCCQDRPLCLVRGECGDSMDSLPV